jgi:hypothetical protein
MRHGPRGAVGSAVVLTYGPGRGEGHIFIPYLAMWWASSLALPLICQDLNEKPQKDLEISLSQGQEINGKVRELGANPLQVRDSVCCVCERMGGV